MTNRQLAQTCAAIGERVEHDEQTARVNVRRHWASAWNMICTTYEDILREPNLKKAYNGRRQRTSNTTFQYDDNKERGHASPTLRVNGRVQTRVSSVLACTLVVAGGREVRRTLGAPSQPWELVSRPSGPDAGQYGRSRRLLVTQYCTSMVAEYPSGRERADEGSLCSREALPASRNDQLTNSVDH
jgi:hypothetical protein